MNLSPRFQRVRWLLLAAVPFVLVALARLDEPPPAEAGDYAQYLLHAKALAEGRPYSDIGYIYTERSLVGPANQPPGWPIVLAPFVAVFGVDSPVFRLLTIGLVGLFAVMSGAWFWQRDERVAAFGVAAFVPLALQTQGATSTPLSDPLFCVLAWSVLNVADSREPWTPRRGLAVGLLTVAAISVRVAGVALLPALLLFAVLNWPRTARPLAPVLALFLAAAAMVFFAGDHVPFLNQTMNGVRRFLGSPMGSVEAYRGAFLSATLYPFAGNRANDIYHVVTLPVIAIGAWQFVRLYWRRPVTTFVVSYVALLAISPVRVERYAWPLIPVIAYCAVAGLKWLGDRLPGRAGGTPVALGFVGLVAIASSVHLASIPAGRSLSTDPDSRALFAFLAAKDAEHPARVVFINPRVLTLSTGIPAMPVPFGTPEDMRREFIDKRISLIVVRRQFRERRSEAVLAELVANDSVAFPALFRNATYAVHAFLSDAPPPAPASAVSRPGPSS